MWGSHIQKYGQLVILWSTILQNQINVLEWLKSKDNTKNSDFGPTKQKHRITDLVSAYFLKHKNSTATQPCFEESEHNSYPLNAVMKEKGQPNHNCITNYFAAETTSCWPTWKKGLTFNEEGSRTHPHYNSNKRISKNFWTTKIHRNSIMWDKLTLASLVSNYTGTRLSKQTQDLVLTIANREIIQLVSEILHAKQANSRNWF